MEVKKRKGEVQGQPRSMVTGPGKKGGYGFIKTTLSERQGAKGVAGEYEYLSDPIDWHKRVRCMHFEPVIRGRLP